MSPYKISFIIVSLFVKHYFLNVSLSELHLALFRVSVVQLLSNGLLFFRLLSVTYRFFIFFIPVYFVSLVSKIFYILSYEISGPRFTNPQVP